MERSCDKRLAKENEILSALERQEPNVKWPLNILCLLLLVRGGVHDEVFDKA